jgi:hypothetical protein
MAHRFGQFVLLTAVCFEPAGLRAQDGASLRLVEEQLQDAHRLAEHHAFVFVGGISRMETVSLPRCRTTVEEKLEYSISTLLWNDPESYAENGSKVAKGFTDCTHRRIPVPFFEGTKVIVYCEAEPVQGDRCLPPAKYTDVTLNNVASWIEELRRKAGDPVLLQIHEHLRDSLELLPSRPILFLGEVSGWKAADRILLSTK